jgi:hypothetical protein
VPLPDVPHSRTHSTTQAERRHALDVADLKRRAPIVDVWSALGGGQLRKYRGQAWWRTGNGFSVSLDAEQGLWYDHAAGTGGDIIDLVRTARGCSFADAMRWLAEFAGIDISPTRPIYRCKVDTGWLSDCRDARYWRMAAVALAEQALEELGSTDRDRSALTRLLAAIRLGDLSLVTEYRTWRQRDPALTYAMLRAGQIWNARQQNKLVSRIWEVAADGAQA